MFPINFNFPYRKKDGSLITMEKALDGAGADLDLIDLDDVAITDPAEGEVLVYDNATKKWKNSDVITDTGWTTVPSANITNMSSGAIKYRVKNGYCTISMATVTPTNTANDITVSNLPKSTAFVGGALTYGGTFQTDCAIGDNSTSLKISKNAGNTQPRYGSLVYPV